MWSNRVTSTEKWKVSASKSCSPLGCSWTMVSLQSPQPWGHASEHQGSPPGSATLDAAWSSCTQGWRLHHSAYFFCTRHGCPTALLGPLKCHRVFCPHCSCVRRSCHTRIPPEGYHVMSADWKLLLEWGRGESPVQTAAPKCSACDTQMTFMDTHADSLFWCMRKA